MSTVTELQAKVKQKRRSKRRVKGLRAVFRYPFLTCLWNERLYPATRLEWTPLSTEEAIRKKVPVFLTIKDGTPVVASYDKVVRITCNNEPGLSRHILSVSSSIMYVKKITLTPFFCFFYSSTAADPQKY